MTATPESRAEQLLSEGQAAVHDGDLARAVDTFALADAAYAQLPGSAEQRAHLLNLIGTLRTELDDDAGAAAAFRESVQLFFEHVPGSEADQARAMLGLGHALAGEQDFGGATRAYTGAVNAFLAAGDPDDDAGAETIPELIETYMSLGIAAVNDEQWEHSAAAYQRAIELLREYPDTSTELGLCWMGLGVAFTQGEEDEFARRGFTQALVMFGQDPEDAPFVAQTWARFGVHHENAGRTADAVAAYEQARDIYAGLEGYADEAAECEADAAALRRR